MVYSERVMTDIHTRKKSNTAALDITARPSSASSVDTLNDWRNMRCCMPRQNCLDRNTWVSIASPSVPLVNYSGLIVPLGNADFLMERYRSCSIEAYDSNKFCA